MLLLDCTVHSVVNFILKYMPPAPDFHGTGMVLLLCVREILRTQDPRQTERYPCESCTKDLIVITASGLSSLSVTTLFLRGCFKKKSIQPSPPHKIIFCHAFASLGPKLLCRPN
jgi:hypothetical protein